MKRPRKAKNRSKPAASRRAPPLVGRYFYIWGDDGFISRQGRVIAQIDPTHYLVHIFCWLDHDGVPDAHPHTHALDSTLLVCTLDDMTIQNINQNERAPGAWQFHEDDEYLLWYEHCAPRRPRRDSSLGDATEQTAA
jgi:hypothetical protein